MSKTMRSLGKKIKGKKKVEDKEPDGDDYWNDKDIQQRTKINFDSDDDDAKSDFLVVENDARQSTMTSATMPSQSARQGATVSARHRPSGATPAGSARQMPPGSARLKPPGVTDPSPTQRISSEHSPSRLGASASEMARMEAEIKGLKKQVKELKAGGNGGTSGADCQKTLEAFMDRNQAPSLEHFVSRKDKFTLLDRAIERHDGNAITRIIIWLKDTLKRDPHLMKELMMPERAAGMNHYICYLKEMKEYDELSELLISLNRPEEAAYLEYQRKLEQNKSAKARSMALEATLKYHFESQRELDFDTTMIREQKRLLELLPRMIQQSSGEGLKETDTVAQTLWHSCMHHYTENVDYAPKKLKHTLNICDNEYEWIVLTALAKRHEWEMIEVMVKKDGGLLSKFSGPKFETSIQLANLIHVLGVHAMPVLKLRKYILAMDDIDERKKQAYRWKDHHTALDCYQKTQDHQGLARHLTEIADTDENAAIRQRFECVVRESKNWTK